MKFTYALYGLFLALAAAGCSSNDVKVTNTPTKQLNSNSAYSKPFRFQKPIEVAPGMDYDVLSWGRGTDSTGAYLILRSDSSAKRYTTTTGDLDGVIKDVFNTDLDSDGNPEIFIQSQTLDSTRYGKIDAYEFNGDQARKLEFPKLNRRQKSGYHGGDVFLIKEDKIVRTYPVYDSDNSNARLTGEKRILEYSFHGNNFNVTQLSTDSTKASTGSGNDKSKQTASSPPASSTAGQNADRQSHNKSSRHHTTKKHSSSSRRHESSRRRRHHSR